MKTTANASQEIAELSKKRNQTRNDTVNATFRKYLVNNMIWLILLLLWIYFSFTIEGFTNPINLINIVFHSSFLGILVIGETLCLLTANMDLSVESTLAFSAMVGAWLMGTARFSSGLGVPAFLAIPAVLLVGILIGSLNAFFIVKLKMNALIVTLAMLIVVRGLTINLTDGNVLSKLPATYNWIGQTTLWRIPLVVFIFLVFYIVFHILLSRHRFGRHVYATGDNVEAAYASGINTDRVTMLAFILSGLLAAFAGFLMTSRIGAVPPSLGTGMAFEVFAAAVIGGVSLKGGKGNLVGALAGVLLLGTITNALNLSNLSPYYIEIIRGLIIFIAVLVDTLKTRFIR